MAKMTTPLSTIERRLQEQLRRDAAHPSRRKNNVVNVSGTSCGLALAIGFVTGETNEAIYARLG